MSRGSAFVLLLLACQVIAEAQRDPYEVLGVDKKADDRTIRKAYFKLAKEHHPDKGGDETKFKEIAAAYELLSDAEKRKQYDQFGFGGGGGGGFNFNRRDGSDPFATFRNFGNKFKMEFDDADFADFSDFFKGGFGFGGGGGSNSFQQSFSFSTTTSMGSSSSSTSSSTFVNAKGEKCTKTETCKNGKCSKKVECADSSGRKIETNKKKKERLGSG